jgi:PleD family two-component response regulator
MHFNQTNHHKKNILVVDDTPDNLRLLSAMLTAQGFEVRKALNGKMALTACKMVLPDVILLDINMPGMDGYQVCQQLKADDKTSEIPVIFISALDDVVDKVKAFDVGGVDYIAKLFTPTGFRQLASLPSSTDSERKDGGARTVSSWTGS